MGICTITTAVPRRSNGIARSRAVPALWFCVLLLVFSSGCSSRVTTNAIRSNLALGNLETLEHDLAETHESYGEFVTALNLARVYQVHGRWVDSIKAFEDALVLLEDYEARAVVNMRAVLAGAGTVLFSRGAGEYYGVGYERSLLHTFNAVNYLMLGDFAGAAVEMRRMDKRQEIWLEESQARIEKYLESEKRLESPDELPQGYTMRDLLRDQEVRGLLNNYQDPFSYSLGSILYRLADDPQSAEVSMRRAIALHDNANRLFSQAWPGPSSAKGDQGSDAVPPAPRVPPMPQFRSGDGGKNGLNENNPPKTQEVTVIAFTGLAPALRVENVRAWFPTIGYILIDLPSYANPVFGAKPAVTASFGSQTSDIGLYPLLRTDLLAYRTLWDEVSMEVTFAISRAAVRAGISAASYAAARSNEDTREYASLIATLTTVLMDVFASSMAESVRNWETLPNTGYLALADVPRGGTVTISVGGDKTSVDLPPDVRGVIIMATELSNSNLKVHHVTY
ncbi:MAG: hypothetical protein LIP28_07370 [Deltaproteobacteria bacterium]|nr:hypothetical protein [Deltaproteobacteria bacterium]